MKQFYTLFFIFCNIYFISAQTGNVGIGTSTPDGTTKLDISATDKGILIPRVALTALNAIGPITNALGTAATNANMQDGLMVYNTATAGSSPNIVTPGYYYWDKSNNKWVRVGNSKDNDWTVANTTATPATKTDNQYITGNVGIGDFSAADPSYNLDVKGTGLFRNGNISSVYTNNQLLFGYSNTNTYMHAIKTRHNSNVGSGNAIDFFVWKNGNVSTDVGSQQVMTLESVNGGSVGIGTTAPTENLTIIGNASISGDNTLEFGKAVSGKESNAGKIGYEVFTSGALDIVGAGTTNNLRIVKVFDNLVVSKNVIAGAGLIGGKIEIQQGPNTGADNQYHRVQLSTGFAGSAFSAYASGSYLDGDAKLQGVDIAPLLSATSAWYVGNGTAATMGASNGQNCNSCTHACNCPDGYVATGWEAYAASQLDTYMKLKCTKLITGYTTVETGAGVESVSSFPNSTSDNITHSSTCPTGTFIKGISIYANSYLDGGLVVYCTGIKKN